MQEATPIRPAYTEKFQCIGPDCEDICCQGWGIPIDQPTYEKYQQLPAGPLRTLIDASVLRTPQDGEGALGADKPKTSGAKTPIYAKIRMDASNQCPMLTADRLCGIQVEFGEELLSHTCATYPRVVHSVGGMQEKALTLSCPEAARLVLLSPDLLSPGAETGGDADHGASALAPHFYAIRDAALALIRNRLYPLWQRLFLLGVFCRRLDSIAQGEREKSVPDFLRDFEQTVATGALRTAMETLPLDHKAQLDVVLRLAGMMLHRSNVRPRFVECVNAFTAGIGNGPGATLESLTAQYSLAHDRFYEPFFRHSPHILENYLINTVFRCQFPFGKEGMRVDAQPSMTREYALLTAQFALMKGLLIGVAGSHREGFSDAHVVHTVQAASKHFEHHPDFLDLAHQMLVERQMDGARGLAILLRNAETSTPEQASLETPVPAPETSAPPSAPAP